MGPVRLRDVSAHPDHLEHLDVLIIGAGLSGIGAACHLEERLPGTSYLLLEARDAMGGTWDLFRYPGIRSDSDMFTLGYRFRPWTEEKSIADGPSILSYVRETAAAYGVDQKVRYDLRVARAEWSSEESRWTVTAERGTGETVTFTCGFLWSCSGYYRYDEGYSPRFEGSEEFVAAGGGVTPPQHWPEALAHAGKRVVVIGGGATAVTLVPAMARDAAHVTMLQRSPSYVLALPGRDPVADLLRRLLPAKVAYPIVRWKNVALATMVYQLSRRAPRFVRALIRKQVQLQVPRDYDVDTHFKPRYAPWDQRLCLVPNGDLFRSIKKGEASVVTDAIETFTEKGITLASGQELEADLVVTATGLNLLALGGTKLAVDGREIELPETVGYKGMMLSDVPNLAIALGYTNASWTLKCDLTCEYVCRLLNHMDANGQRVATPRRPDPSVEVQPFLDLTSGYVLRSIDQFPKQGTRAPWRLYQNYPRDLAMLRYGPVIDEGLDLAA